MCVAGHSTADTIPVGIPATRKMKWPLTAPSLRMLSPTARVARRPSTRCPSSQDGRVKTPFRTATSHAIRFWLAVICARTNATLAPARLAPSPWTLRAGAEGQWPTRPATRGKSSTLTASAPAGLSSTAGGTSAESAVALARRRRPSGGSRSGLPTRTSSRSIFACRCAAVSSSAASTPASSSATKGPACRARRPSSTRSAAPADGRSSSLRSHAGRGRPSAGSPAPEPVRVAIRRSNTSVTPMMRPARPVPT